MSLNKPNKQGMYIGGVSFNEKNPDDMDLLKHARKRPNFSGYVKRLIHMDQMGMLGGRPAAPQEDPVEEQEDSLEFDADLMRNLT